jgi:formate hydrogenlyase transcriptional activator
MTHEAHASESLLQEPLEAPAGAGEASAAPTVPEDLRALHAAVEGTAAGTGQEFFHSLVRHLAEAIDMHYAVVAEFPKAPPHVRTLAFWERDRLADNFEYDFTGTPCAEIVRGGLVHYPTGVSKLFPRATPLVERGIDSYLAVPFLDGAGNILGHLAVFDERPLSVEPRRLFIFRIFAARATAELQRLQAEKRLREGEARYRHLFESAPIGYLTVGTDLRILNVNRRMTEMLGYPVEELVGAQIHSFLPDTPAGKVRSEEVHRMHLAGAPVSGWELEMRRKDNRPLWVNLWLEGGRDDQGAILPARAIAVNITERVLAEQERARLQEQNLYLQEEIKANHNFEKIVGHSAGLRAVLADVSRVAATDASVLITGETGTGKELVARAVHSASKRSQKPLIKVNCAALPAGLVESELFGHEKGAFSGAIAKRLGRFELANGGTIFLDEIGELPAEAQVKLLRVLQEREFDRVGGAAPMQVDVRVIAATNRDLLKEVQEKTFREDLYYRLNVFPVRVPPLRERREDIPLLVHFLVNKFARRIGKHLDEVSRQTMQRLEEYPWPGNVRELENILERAVILATGSTLDIAPDLLPTPAPAPPSSSKSDAPSRTETGAVRLAAPTAEEGSVSKEDTEGQPALADAQHPDRPLLRLDAVERDYILTVLQHTNWVITGGRGAATVLGLHPSTLRSRIKKLGISRAPG